MDTLWLGRNSLTKLLIDISAPKYYENLRYRLSTDSWLFSMGGEDFELDHGHLLAMCGGHLKPPFHYVHQGTVWPPKKAA